MYRRHSHDRELQQGMAALKVLAAEMLQAIQPFKEKYKSDDIPLKQEVNVLDEIPDDFGKKSAYGYSLSIC